MIDASKSMQYGDGDTNKLEYAKTLTAALAYLIIHQRDSVALDPVLFDYATEEPDAWALVVRHLDKPEVGLELRELRDRLGTAFADLLLRRRRADPALSPAALAVNERRARLLVPLMYGSMLSMVSWWLEHPDTPRERAEQMAVEFIWLGLDRLRAGERLPKA